jgi:hypothetical protein
MSEFRYIWGAVYILENSIAQRVKIGMTITNNITGRLGDVNDMWLERKVTCQICGGRSVNVGGQVPRHVVSGIRCPGGNSPPMEKNFALAQSYLEKLKNRHGELSGTEKGSVTRIVKTLERRIELYRSYRTPAGAWQYRVGYYTERAEQAESLSHKILAEHLDRSAPFGEVFSCSVSEATGAVEAALSQLGLLDSARKEIA